MMNNAALHIEAPGEPVRFVQLSLKVEKGHSWKNKIKSVWCADIFIGDLPILKSLFLIFLMQILLLLLYMKG